MPEGTDGGRADDEARDGGGAEGSKDADELDLAASIEAFVAWERAANLDGLPELPPLRLGGPVLPAPPAAGAVPIPDSPSYRIEGELGRGGMGVVLRAWDPRLRRVVAMKLAREPSSERQLRRFLREARITGQLQHPGIVPVHELGRDASGKHFFTMPLVRGELLDRVFALAARERKGWSLPRVVGVLVRVSETLAYAHQRGVVHRDVKPQNVKVGPFGETYVLDWGLAKVLEGSEGWRELAADELEDAALADAALAPPDLGDSAALHSRAGDVVGTPNWVAPEQAAGARAEVGPAADVYSVGALLYTLLAAKPPYAEIRSSSSSSFEAVCAGPPEPIRRLARRGPAELMAICERAMARQPEQRYASMSDLADDLRAFLEGRVVRAHRVGAWAELRKWVARNRSVAAWMAATVVTTLLGLSALAVFEARRRREEFLLGDIPRLPFLLQEAEGLWPAVPAHIPDLERWLEQAELCADRVDIHRARAAELRAAAGPSADAEVRRELRVWTELVEQQAVLQTTIADVRARLVFAREVSWRSLDEPSVAARWRDALASIADLGECPVYRGLRLVPQLGLVPIGRDPRSGLWEFAHLQSGTVPRRWSDGQLELDAGTGLVFVLVPGGSFWMGAQRDDGLAPRFDEQAFAWEGPPHVVCLEAFLLSKYEMTQSQWQRFTGTNPSEFSAPGQAIADPRLHPVESVSWTLCQRVLSRMGLVLPTEAQWEYGARGWTDTSYWWGDEYLSIRERCTANLADRQTFHFFKEQQTIEWDWVEWVDDGHAFHAPVGTFAANPFGLHDVVGNVWEWCEDLLTPYHVSPRAGDGLRSEIRVGAQRVTRGGSFRNPYGALRSSVRENNAADVRESYLGVRPARVLGD